MVLKPEPIVDAIRWAADENSHIVLLSPQGKTFDQQKAKELASKEHVVLICGHYEGFDERIRNYVDEQLSLGDFVMTGGEPAAAAMADATIRLLPGVIKENSFSDDSFYNGLLEYPQYTKPYEFEGMKVPEVLLSGHHANIEKWRKEQSLRNTFLHRPDLLVKKELSETERELLESIKEEYGQKEEDKKNGQEKKAP